MFALTVRLPLPGDCRSFVVARCRAFEQVTASARRACLPLFSPW
jgi:hypothetical protein